MERRPHHGTGQQRHARVRVPHGHPPGTGTWADRTRGVGRRQRGTSSHRRTDDPFGIDEALVYLLARAKTEEAGQILGSALAVAGVAGVLAAGLSELLQWLYFAPAAPGVAAITLYAFGTFPLVNIGTQVMLGAQRARQQFALWNACRLSVPVLYLGTIVALAVAHRLSVGSAMLALYTANLVLFAYLTLRLRRESEIRVTRKDGANTLLARNPESPHRRWAARQSTGRSSRSTRLVNFHAAWLLRDRSNLRWTSLERCAGAGIAPLLARQPRRQYRDEISSALCSVAPPSPCSLWPRWAALIAPVFMSGGVREGSLRLQRALRSSWRSARRQLRFQR